MCSVGVHLTRLCASVVPKTIICSSVYIRLPERNALHSTGTTVLTVTSSGQSFSSSHHPTSRGVDIPYAARTTLVIKPTPHQITTAAVHTAIVIVTLTAPSYARTHYYNDIIRVARPMKF